MRNTYRAMETALALDDFAVLAEEDIQVADDVIEYFTWCRREYEHDASVRSACAHVHSARGGEPSQVTRACWFNPLVWGTWRSRWPALRSTWTGTPGDRQFNPHHASRAEDAWDNNLRVVFQERGWHSVFPVRSRTQHQGKVSTLMPVPLADHFYLGSLSDCFAAHYDPQAYHEVPFPEEIGLLV